LVNATQQNPLQKHLKLRNTSGITSYIAVLPVMTPYRLASVHHHWVLHSEVISIIIVPGDVRRYALSKCEIIAWTNMYVYTRARLLGASQAYS